MAPNQEEISEEPASFCASGLPSFQVGPVCCGLIGGV